MGLRVSDHDDGVRKVNPEMIAAMEVSFQTAKLPISCPFCGRWWDQADAARAMHAGPEAWARWYMETINAEVNAEGDDLGHRGQTV
jgi:hypothetical protein